jgi:hypothetical protein
VVALLSTATNDGGRLVDAATDAADKLSPAMRAAVLIVLAGIVLIGLLLVAAILLGGSWVRRQGKHRRAPAVPPDRAPLPRSVDRGDSFDSPPNRTSKADES